MQEVHLYLIADVSVGSEGNEEDPVDKQTSQLKEHRTQVYIRSKLSIVGSKKLQVVVKIRSYQHFLMQQGSAKKLKLSRINYWYFTLSFLSELIITEIIKIIF